MAVLSVKVISRAAKNEVAGWLGTDILKVKLTAPPVDGEANSALICFLSTILEIKKSGVQIKSGWQSPRKTVEVNGLKIDEI